nr:hypothetical protein CFP56_68702 [Quercus suber]
MAHGVRIVIVQAPHGSRVSLRRRGGRASSRAPSPKGRVVSGWWSDWPVVGERKDVRWRIANGSRGLPRLLELDRISID